MNCGLWASSMTHSGMLGNLFASYVLWMNEDEAFRTTLKTETHTVGSARRMSWAITRKLKSQNFNFCETWKWGGIQCIWCCDISDTSDRWVSLSSSPVETNQRFNTGYWSLSCDQSTGVLFIQVVQNRLGNLRRVRSSFSSAFTTWFRSQP